MTTDMFHLSLLQPRLHFLFLSTTEKRAPEFTPGCFGTVHIAHLCIIFGTVHIAHLCIIFGTVHIAHLCIIFGTVHIAHLCIIFPLFYYVSLTPVACRKARVLFTLFAFACTYGVVFKHIDYMSNMADVF
jgi:hypothetical protein